MTPPSYGHWSVFKQIFADHWEPFQRAYPQYQIAYYEGLVAKMLDVATRKRSAMSNIAACTAARGSTWWP
jgi:hypothetical protein